MRDEQVGDRYEANGYYVVRPTMDINLFICYVAHDLICQAGLVNWRREQKDNFVLNRETYIISLSDLPNILVSGQNLAHRSKSQSAIVLDQRYSKSSPRRPS